MSSFTTADMVVTLSDELSLTSFTSLLLIAGHIDDAKGVYVPPPHSAITRPQSRTQERRAQNADATAYVFCIFRSL